MLDFKPSEKIKPIPNKINEIKIIYELLNKKLINKKTMDLNIYRPAAKRRSITKYSFSIIARVKNKKI